MAMIRCPHCNMALTNDEARASACVVCGESLGSVAKATSRLPEYGSNRSTVHGGDPVIRKNLGFLPLFGILFAGGITFAIFQAALNGFRSGGGAGTAAGVTITYFILYGLGMVGNKKA